MNHRRILIAGVVAVAIATFGILLSRGPAEPRPSAAFFHLAVIDEVMTSYGGDSSVQFVEIKMLSGSQNFVRNTVLGAFSSTGAYVGDVLVVPSDVPNSGSNVRWLMATSQFQAATGLAPDFIMPAGLPTAGGMVCWGAPGVSAPDPGTWSHSNPENYTDCLAYGTYSGPTNSHIGAPTSLDAIGHSLQRTQDTNNNSNDFVCGDPATPTKNNPLNTSVSMPATTPCTPCPDTDSDGWTDCEEDFIGSDPMNACTPGGWPPDPAPAPDGDGRSHIEDVTFAAARFGATAGQDLYSSRGEIASQDGIIHIDDVTAFAARFGLTCLP